MSALVVIGVVWLTLSLGLAVILSGAIRLADSEEYMFRDGREFRFDHHPCDAAFPALAVGAGSAHPAPPVPRSATAEPR